MKHYQVLSTLLAVHCVYILAQNHALEGSICEANSDVGRCVHVAEYPDYLQALNKRDRSQEEADFVSSHSCGTTSTGQALACRPVRLNDPACGAQLTDRIVRGTLTDLDEYPWMAVFQYRKYGDETGFHCGGVLITQRFVLSAAHCLVGLRRGWEPIKVRLGEWDFESDPDCVMEEFDRYCAEPVQEFDLEQIIVHEKFSVRNLHKTYDIALVKLSRDATMNAYVKPICLPEPGAVDVGRLFTGRMTAAGWGKTENATSSRYKMHASLGLADTASCRSDYAKAWRIQLGDGQFCAHGNRGQDTCSGDSGGPLMKQDSSGQGKFYVIGIVSFGPRRCGEQLPGVYTKVDHYYPWIVRKVLESS